MISFGSTQDATGSGATLTWSHTISGVDTALYVAINDLDNTLTGVTYAGVPLTQLKSTITLAQGHSSLWQLINPTLGANNIVATRSGSGQTTTGFSASYNGVGQVGQPDSQATNQNGGFGAITASTVVVRTGCWLVGMGCGYAQPGASPITSSRTDRKTATLGGGNVASLLLFDSNAAVGIGTQTAIITLTFGGIDPALGYVLVSLFPTDNSNPIFFAGD